MVPDVDGFNAKYRGFQPNSTNVFACNGSDDPWQGATINATISATYVEKTAVCDGCGHCRDLQRPSASDPATITQQRTELASYVSQWLKAAAPAPVAATA